MSTTTLIIAATNDAQAWPNTARTIADLVTKLGPANVSGVQVLGTQLGWGAADWRANMPMPLDVQGAHLFISPVLRRLARLPEAIFIVGSGEVVDLADWVHDNTGTRWALVRTSTTSLQPLGLGLFEVALNQLDRVVDLPQAARNRSRAPSLSMGSVSHLWRLDKCGYPMVFVPPLDAHVQLFSLTKPQFEQFLVEAKQPERHPAWYAELLKLNPRLSPAAKVLNEPEMLFTSGLLPADAEAFMRWHGGGLTWLSPQQWLAAYSWLRSQSPSALPFDITEKLHPSARLIWQRLLETYAPKTLADLGYFEDGVADWVRDGNRTVGMGLPAARLGGGFHNIQEPHVPTSIQHRSGMFGARFML